MVIRQMNNPIKYCRKCGVVLTKDNWGLSRQKYHDYHCKECRGKSSKNRYRKGREKFIRKHKEWYQKNKEQQKEYYQRNKDKISKKHQKGMMKVKVILGDVCFVCRRQPIKYHEIHGKKHPTTPNYLLKHIEDFVPLCHFCHNALHRYHKYKKEIEELEAKMIRS